MDPNFTHVSTSVKYWDEVGRRFYEKYHNIELLYQKNLELIVQGKPIVGPLGREWSIKFDGIKLPETTCVNYPVQGTGADIMMLVRISFWNRLRKQSWAHLVKMVSTVHDSLFVDAPAYLKDELCKMMHDVFNDLVKNIWKIFHYEWKVPLDCETKVGNNMKDMIKYGN